jgi:hypothetical protein
VLCDDICCDDLTELVGTLDALRERQGSVPCKLRPQAVTRGSLTVYERMQRRGDACVRLNQEATAHHLRLFSIIITFEKNVKLYSLIDWERQHMEEYFCVSPPGLPVAFFIAEESTSGGVIKF